MPSSNHWMTSEFAASVIFTMTFFFFGCAGSFVAVIFSSCFVSLVVVCGLLVEVASLIAEHGP